MPKDGTATRQRILDAAEKLVIDNGYAATSLDQVIAASGTSKGAFFHHFASKADLARALVGRYAAADIAHLEQALAAVDGARLTAPERLVAFIRLFEESADELMSAQSSCLYVSVLAEQQLARADTTDEIRRAILRWREGLSTLVVDALAAVGRPGAIDPDALADHVFVTFEGAFVLCRSAGDPGHMRTQLRTLRQLVEALVAT